MEILKESRESYRKEIDENKMKTRYEMTEEELERMEVLISMVVQTIAIEKRTDDELIAMTKEYYYDLLIDDPLSILLCRLIERLEEK